MSKWNYGDKYRLYNMKGEIKIGTGIVKVHDIFKPLPKFMKQADCLFIDPPCSVGNLKSFYTKADIIDQPQEYQSFADRLFECIKEIKPRDVFIEVFKSNKDDFIERLSSIYNHLQVIDSYYYHNPKNKCWIIAASNDPFYYGLGKQDEEDIIRFICTHWDYKCIGDLCMGRGLVGWYAYKANRPFVGTELNKKRLAVLVDKITKDMEVK